MMTDFSLGALVDLLDARAVNADQAKRCSRVSTDTRNISKGDLFVALRGQRFDAHDYVGDAIGKGAVAAVVDHEIDSELPQLVVADTLKALGTLGWNNRQGFSGPLIAVTGSSGKTSVKEMLASMFATLGPTLATRGNLNNEIGVPLTLLELQQEHEFAVVELGASAVGEIARTTRLAQPKVAVLTNALGAHLEGFGSLQNIVTAKGEIFEGLVDGGVGVVNADDPNASYWLEKLHSLGHSACRFSIDGREAELQARNLTLTDAGTWRCELHYRNRAVQLQLGVMGRHNIANAAAAAAAWVSAGFPLEDAIKGLEAFSAVPGRLCPISLQQGALLIDDSYNANPGSVKAAIDVLASLPGPRTLLLGDMAELGDDAAALHADVGRHAAARGIEQLMTIGVLSQQAALAAAENGSAARHFTDFDEYLAALKELDLGAGTLLAKGSRSAGMERAVNALKGGQHPRNEEI
ncbi:UDP-N-acetylmuramoylalanyl-D-glutamyl-2,6- diaminopimelate--D-alanyl-D-alanine ligase [Marinobacterium lacunae]|uniref:UDP-N-acetylmuramoyl-tripeptide--D-alanyl-D-alanine ligase n=1 Tax=Marinobacterium lacunae TaxID=1232683 RepID=A0A081G3N3_9GAMM|nr:UDP-N-acetylmuramoyl-tripeptide--D-alanyl-D-alanine ligase [Marinobacterium lacunae]KEA65388.1 UDP-N-acetylmuramoylalanyl-D-glutamyl-2,6- diaminopimelate--D-alanyl-D-alanine ligase [Marinobacterium lacunae]